jgi:oligopeptide transport system substrate-binding protein
MVGNSYNDPDYNNPAFDTLMDEALAAGTLAVHFEKMYAAQDLLMADLPFIPIYYYTDTMMAQSYLKDWNRSILGTIDLTRAYIQK